LKIILEKATGIFVIFEVDALIYVVLSEAEKQVPYGELFGTNASVTL